MISPYRLAASTLLGTCLTISPIALLAQENIQPKSAEKIPETKVNYSNEQLMTATVHQAWILSGENEANFFDMVQKLAAVSAQNRKITLPNTADAGRRMGDYIKATAESDTDQLLYAVVDKAVLRTAHTPVHKAATKPE